MVTHVPPSPSFSSATFSQRAQSSSSSIPPYNRQPYPVYPPPNAPEPLASIPPARPHRSGPHTQALYTRSREGSVSSRASTSAARDQHGRRHSHQRHTRTVSGSGSTTPRAPTQNEFPWFSQTGDVEITLRDRRGRRDQKYLLHSLILSQNSGFFAEEVDRNRDLISHPQNDMPGRQLRLIREDSGSRATSTFSSRSSRSTHSASEPARSRFELNWNTTYRERRDDDPVLVHASARESRTRAAPPPANVSVFRSLAQNVSHMTHSTSYNTSSTELGLHTHPPSTSREDDLINAYDNLFRTFYNHAPLLDSDNVANAYVECKTLLRVAAQHRALPAVGPRVDHHLLRFRSRLWRQIAKYPPSYLKLGHLARSRPIFTEALIHVVGQWPAGAGQLRRGEADDALLDLVEDKVADLEELKARVDARLFRLSLSTPRGERVSPTTAWLDWLAVSLFRHWLAEHSAPPAPSILKDRTSSVRTTQRQTPPQNVGRTYRLIATAGQAYLPHEELKRFLKNSHPPARDVYTRDNMRKLERRVEEVKNLAREVVKPLVRNFLEGDGVTGFEHLTCTRLEDRDLEITWGAS